MPGFCACVPAIPGSRLVGNSLLLGPVATGKTLQAPMYQLLGLLTAADLIIVATSTVPKALVVLWGLSSEISFGACLAQLFVALIGFIAESSVLLAMAVDRYVAICQPPRSGASAWWVQCSCYDVWCLCHITPCAPIPETTLLWAEDLTPHLLQAHGCGSPGMW